jgi:hypothetical protein
VSTGHDKLVIGERGKRFHRRPFHVKAHKVGGKHVGYDIMWNNARFLVSADTRYPIKRYEAYAICRLLNDMVTVLTRRSRV